MKDELFQLAGRVRAWTHSLLAVGNGHGVHADPASDPETIRQLLERVLASREFANATRLQGFLRYVVEQRLQGAESIKETELAIEVFNRRSTFDPTGDSVVRVAASNLRSRLRDYALGSGVDDAVAIEMPKGSYLPVFHSRSEASTPVTRTSRRWVLSAAVLGAILIVAAILGYRAWHKLSHEPFSSIAVLPFMNLTGDPENEYFDDGLVEDLTTGLARMPGLRVAARTSAFAYRNRSTDAREIGRKLGVDSLLEGSVRREGHDWTITAQLISTTDGYHIWSGSYRGGRSEIASIEEEMLSAVDKALRGTGVLQARVPPAHVPNETARELFWRGLYIRRRFLPNPEYRQQSIRYFEQAVAADPNYVEAWAWLAAMYATMAHHRQDDWRTIAAKAKDTVRRTLELDSSNAMAHAALANILYSCDWNWPEAEREFKLSLEAGSDDPWVHNVYANGLMHHGRFDDAISQMSRASTLDPLTYRVMDDRAQMMYLARRYAQAIPEAEAVLKGDPGFYPARMILGLALSATGRHREALSAFDETLRTRRTPENLARYGQVLAVAGRTTEARQVLEELKRDSGVPRLHLAYIEAALGDRPAALAHLEQAVQSRDADVLLTAHEPVFDSLHSEPAFRALLKQMGL